MRNHGEDVTPDKALELLARLAAFIPKCPDCKSKSCGAWVEYYMEWVLKSTTDVEGPMAMFLALVNKAGEQGVYFSRDELEAVRRTKTVVVTKYEDQGIYQVMIVDKGVIVTDFQQKMQDEDESDWPTLLNP